MSSESPLIRWLAAKWETVKSVIWPVHAGESKKLIPMVLMLFFINFNYSILRNMKDVLVMSNQTTGAAVIPFIKVWVLLPMAILITVIFTKLTNRISQERVFYIIISGFLIFFALFAFVLYPMRDYLHLGPSADALQLGLPVGLHGFVSMVRNWTFTAFYVMSELWGSMIMTVLFWGFANEVTRLSEARRFYSIFGVGANFAAIIAGQVGSYFSHIKFNPNLPFGLTDWEQTIDVLVLLVLVSGVITIALFRWMNKRVLNDSCFDDLHYVKRKKGPKGKKLSMRESFSYLANSNYLICIAIIVFSYNLVINLVEVVWKEQLKTLYPNQSDLNSYLNDLTSMIGIVSTVAALSMPRLISRFGWTGTALITPVIMLITSIGFFTFFLLGHSLTDIAMVLAGTTPIAIAVFFGFAQNCLSKAAKYSVFDATKEMTFIPLDHETKLKGKAAIDGVGSRLGKSAGSVIHQGLLVIFTTLNATAPFVGGILMVAIGLWIVATKRLGRQFHELVATKPDKLDADADVPETPNSDLRPAISR
jgi:AAA family ATP:ADP antiporter